MIKYITVITTLLLVGCGPRFITSKPTPPVPQNSPTLPVFQHIDTDKDGTISKTEYADANTPSQDIDIATPINVFAWVIVTMLTVCILAVYLPRGMRYLRQRLKKRSEERIVLND